MVRRADEKARLRAERLERERAAARAASRRRRIAIGAGGAAVAAAVAVAIVLVAGGGDGDDGAGDEPVSPSAQAAQPIADVHGVGVDPRDGALYIATHSGLFRSPEGTDTAVRVDAPEQDLMGFSVAGPGRFIASGHPGPGQDLPPALGLIESRDGGQTWRSLSLQGEADFHVLRAAGQTAYGYDGRLMVTGDGGRSWDELTAPGEIVDLAPSPADPQRVLAATGDGLRVSQDGGRSWKPGNLPGPALLAWAKPRSLFAVDGEGTVYAARDPDGEWQTVGAVQGPSAAFAADRDGNLYFARPDGSVDASADGGQTWAPRSRN